MPDSALARLEAFLSPILPSPAEVAAADAPPLRVPSVAETLTPADDYAEYRGRPVNLEWVTDEEGDLTLNLHLAEIPSEPAAAALERAVAAWYQAGFEEAYPGGGFHSLSDAAWDGRVVRWSVDVGFADRRAAVYDLARRIAGWSAKWGCRIELLRIGIEPP